MPSQLRNSLGHSLRHRPLLPQLLSSLLIGSSLAIATPALSQPPSEAQTSPTSSEAPAEQQPPESPTEAAASEEKTAAPEATPAANPERIPFPEAGITLIPPPGFQTAALFDGFQQEATQSSIMVLSFPAPTEEMVNAFSDPTGLEQRGITLISQEAISISNQPGILAQLEQQAHGQTFSKWILIFGENNKTTLINANFPKALTEELSAPIKASLLSTQADQTLATPAPEETVDFTITPTPGMELALSMGGMLLYSEDGELNGENPEAPLFIISPSFSDVLVNDPGQFSRDRLQQTEQVDAIELITETPITIDDLEGYEITATGQDTNNKTPLLIYQTILFAEDRYYIMQGLVGETSGGTYLTDFKAMAESFQRK